MSASIAWPLELLVEVPPGWWMNANDRSHWAPKATLTRNVRHLAHVSARRDDLPKGLPTPVLVEAIITTPTRRKEDPSNWLPTYKAAVDGLTDYGLWADDDSGHVKGPVPIRGEVTKGRRDLIIRISPYTGGADVT